MVNHTERLARVSSQRCIYRVRIAIAVETLSGGTKEFFTGPDPSHVVHGAPRCPNLIDTVLPLTKVRDR